MTLPARSDLALLGRWLRARVRIQLRTGRAVVFTFAFPLVLLVLFNGLNGNATVDAVGAAGQVKFAQFYTPSIGIFSLTTACYTSVILGIATARDSGLLKRVRGTPLPMSIYLGAWLTGAALTGILAVFLLFAVAIPAFGVQIYLDTLPAALVTLVLGAACLSSVGLAVATPREVGRPGDADRAADVPADLVHLGHLVPARRRAGLADDDRELLPARAHIVHAFDSCFSPGVTGGAWSASDLWSMAIWTVVGLFVATRRFRAEPAQQDAGPRRRVLRRAAA